MLGDKNSSTSIVVKNIENASKFYEHILGLNKIGSDGQDVIFYKSGNSTIIIYESKYAGTNQTTSVTWTVDENMENMVQSLKEKRSQIWTL